jgi:hypothetical protein
LVSSKLPRKFRKIVKVLARFLENVLYFCRPHPTSVVGVNFCGWIFFILVQRKIQKNSEKIKKIDSYKCLLENSEENSGKRKNPDYLLVL